MTTGTTIGIVEILEASFFSTHHASAADVVAGRERPFTAPTFALLVGRARRFISLVTQMHVEVYGALKTVVVDRLPAVFATCHGEIQTAEKLMADVRESSLVSSARFALSVHNTASGVYSVATGRTAPTTTVTGANAIAAGWLEAVLIVLDTGGTVLLSIADEPVPAVFKGPASPVGVAAAFLLGPASRAAPTGRRVALAMSPSIEAVDVDPGRILARAVDAGGRAGSAAITLGRIQPGAMLELRSVADEDVGA